MDVLKNNNCKKVAFFLNLGQNEIQDYSNILNGNPGIGGTQYEILLVSFFLERSSMIDPVLLHTCDGSFLNKKHQFVADLTTAMQYCLNNGINILVFEKKCYKESLSELCQNKLFLIVWNHNYVYKELLDLLNADKSVKKLVNVSKQQFYASWTHPVSKKSTFIFNGISLLNKDFYQKKIEFSDNHNVVYMASIVPVKGFHLLAMAWKDVIKKVPDAQLYVIGSGLLYDRNKTIGAYGIAEKEYEDSFIKYITDENGQVLSSIHFLGILGCEKLDVIGKCKVAVPNPGGIGETFCLSALEMQLMGCNIVTIRSNGFLDTVFNQKRLYVSPRNLSKYIVSALNDERDAYDDLYNFVKKFNITDVVKKWEILLLSLEKEGLSSKDHIFIFLYRMKNIPLLLRRFLDCHFGKKEKIRWL